MKILYKPEYQANTNVLNHVRNPFMSLKGCTKETLDKLEKQLKWGKRINMNIYTRDSVRE